MLSETSKAQKTSIKKSKTCSWREWQNLSIFKKCIKNHSSSSKNCYSTGRGSKVHTSGTHILWEVASCDNILTNMMYSSSHLRQCEWRRYAQWGIFGQYFRRLSSWSWGRDTRRICSQSPHNSTSCRYLPFCNKPHNFICDSLLSTQTNIQNGINNKGNCWRWPRYISTTWPGEPPVQGEASLAADGGQGPGQAIM